MKFFSTSMGEGIRLGIFCVGLGFVFSLILVYTGYLQKPELSLYDRLLSLRAGSGIAGKSANFPPLQDSAPLPSAESVSNFPTAPRHRAVAPDHVYSHAAVTLVTVTESDIQRFRHPLTDSLLAEALKRLLAYAPLAIGVDIYRDYPVPPGVEELQETLVRHPQIVLARKYGDKADDGVSALAGVTQSERIGCVDVVEDVDHRFRRGLLYIGDEPCSGMALRLALLYLAPQGIAEAGDPVRPDVLRLGKASLPPLEAYDGGYSGIDSRGYQVMYDFRTRAITRYSLGQLLSGEVDAGAIAGRIVLIGTDATSVRDHFDIPVPSAGGAGRMVPGVELHALFADQLVRMATSGEGPIQVFSESGEALWLLLWCVAGTAAGALNRSWLWFTCLGLLGFLLQAAAAVALFRWNYWLPAAPAALGWTLSYGLSIAALAHKERLQRQTLAKLFGKHVDSRIVQEIWSERAHLMTGGHLIPRKLTATILFSDLQGFTTITEKLDADVFIRWLNEYLAAMTRIVNQHDGVVIRFVGDAIMAGFGIPVGHDTEAEIRCDARNGVSCAAAMRDALVELNRNWHSRDLPTAGLRIGINTGPVLAGSLGSLDRVEYAVHGDPVNTAARLETFDKENFHPDYLNAPVRILLSEETAEMIGARFKTTHIGTVTLRGRAANTQIYRLD